MNLTGLHQVCGFRALLAHCLLQAVFAVFPLSHQLRQSSMLEHGNMSGGQTSAGPEGNGDLRCTRYAGWGITCEMSDCATSEGNCEPGRGEWLGEHTVRFLSPQFSDLLYFGRNSTVGGVTVGMVRQPTLWKIAKTKDGHIRFALASEPDHVLVLVRSSKTRFEPQLALLLDTAPWQMDFLVSEALHGRGLIIYHPGCGVAVAGRNDEGSGPSSLGYGVTCPPEDTILTRCEKMTHVDFQPPLPVEVVHQFDTSERNFFRVQSGMHGFGQIIISLMLALLLIMISGMFCWWLWSTSSSGCCLSRDACCLASLLLLLAFGVVGGTAVVYAISIEAEETH